MSDAMIRFLCPTCDKRLKAPAMAVGRSTKCPQCGTTIRVPERVSEVEEIPEVLPVPPATRASVTAGALSAFAGGWNNLPWGATKADFRRRFARAYTDGREWFTGEGGETFASIRMESVSYRFNGNGQFFLVEFWIEGAEAASEDIDLTRRLFGRYTGHLLDTFGMPNDKRARLEELGRLKFGSFTDKPIHLEYRSWSDGPIVLKTGDACLRLLNTNC